MKLIADLKTLGDKVSAAMADFAADPFVQVGLIAFCAAWFAIGLPTDLLTAALSIIAITLTQMVLNQQKSRSIDAHRRDVALHAKLDELLLASRNARDEMAGIETLDVKEIEDLKDQAKESIAAANEELQDRKAEEKADAGTS